MAIGPDGLVYVGDQSSSVVQVFDATGKFVREVGRAGVRPGELGSVGAIAVAADNTLFVAEGTNRIDRFDAGGNLVQSFGRGGNGVGEFHFGAGGGNDAPAGGGLAVGGNFLFVSDSFNDRVQRFNLDGSGGAEIVAPGMLAYPRGLTVNGQRLLVADDKHHRIAVFDHGGRFLKAFGGGPGAGPGSSTSRSASPSTRAGASSSPTTSTTASCASGRNRRTPTRRAGAPTARAPASSPTRARSRPTAPAPST